MPKLPDIPGFETNEEEKKEKTDMVQLSGVAAALPAELQDQLHVPETTAPNFERAPFLCYYHERSAQADLIRSQHADARVNDAFVIANGEAYPLPSGWSFTILFSMDYWAQYRDGDPMSGLTLQPPEDQKDPRQHQMLTVMVIDAIDRFWAVCGQWRPIKVNAAKFQLRAIQAAADTKAWIALAPTEKLNTLRGQIVDTSGTPHFRMWTSIPRWQQRKSKAGFTYHIPQPVAQIASLEQLERLGHWLTEENGKELIKTCMDAYMAMAQSMENEAN